MAVDALKPIATIAAFDLRHIYRTMIDFLSKQPYGQFIFFFGNGPRSEMVALAFQGQIKETILKTFD